MMTYTERRAEEIREKEFVQIVVRAGTFDLYSPDGWERVFEDDKLLTIKKRIYPA